MAPKTTPRVIYSRAEQLSDAIVHVIGIAAVLLAVPTLIVLVSWKDASAVWAVTIYGLSFAAMILCSAIYNIFHQSEWSWLLRRLDHSAIYLKIAGTFTPFAFLSGQGIGLMIGLWGAALTGISLKLVSPERFRMIGLALYLAMGWGGVMAGYGIFLELHWVATMLAAIGGVLYTVGVVFYLWDRLPFHNTIWHVFVLVASGVFYAAVTVALLNAPQLP